MSLVEEIRRNDPLDTSIRINFADEDFSDAEITEALEQNLHIDLIWLRVVVDRGTPALRTSWPRLLRHLETRTSLRKVILSWRKDSHQGFGTSLLQALQRNANVRDVMFLGLGQSIGTIVPFLTAKAGHLTNLSLPCKFENNDGNVDGPALLAASLKLLTNLQFLELPDTSQEEYLLAIFASLKHNPSLRTLIVDVGGFSDASWASFKGFMRSNSTIRKLFLYSAEAQSSAIILEIAMLNFSLREVRALNNGNSIFTAEERRLLAFYVDRNERMDQWIEDPNSRASVPEKLRSNVLCVAAQAGDPSVLFRALLAIKGDLGFTKRTRKRKRSEFSQP